MPRRPRAPTCPTSPRSGSPTPAYPRADRDFGVLGRAGRNQSHRNRVGRNGRAVQQVLADHPRFVRHRVVQRDGVDVAPVAIQVALSAGGAGSAELQQPGGGLRSDVIEMHLHLGDSELGFRREPRIGYGGEPRIGYGGEPRIGYGGEQRIGYGGQLRVGHAVDFRCGGRGDCLGGVEHGGLRDVAVEASSPSCFWYSGSSVGRSASAWLKLRSRERSSAIPSSTTEARIPATTAWMNSCNDACCAVGTGAAS